MKKYKLEELQNMELHELQELAQEHEIETDYYEDWEEFLDIVNLSPMEIMRATHFGNIRYWGHDYIYSNVYGNFETLDEEEYKNILIEELKEVDNER
jgi:hypothetical protein